MQRYSVYIMQKLAWSTLLILLSLTSIIWLTQALRFIDFIVNRGVSFSDFLVLTSLLIPSLLMLILPISLFMAVLFVYSRLSVDSELTVLRAAGLSRMQIALPALTVGVAVTCIGYFISLYLMPLTYRQFKDMQAFMRDNYASLLLQEEVFNMPVDGLTVFVHQRMKNGTLRGILVHDNRDPEHPVTMMAEEGQLVQTSRGPSFILVKGNRQELHKGGLELLNFDRYNLDISFYTNTVADRPRETTERYMNELFSGEYTSDDERAKMIAEGHRRISWPFYAFTLSTLALSVLLSGEFNRRGQWRRIALASTLAVGTIMVATGLNTFVSGDVVFFPLIYVFLGALTFGTITVLLRDTLGRVPANREVTA